MTLVRSITAAAYAREVAGKPLEAPLLVALDEAANIAPLPDLPQIASTAAGVGIQLVTIFQDLGQIRSRYGQAASTVVNNHRAKLLLPGISCPDTLEMAARLMGDELVAQVSYSRAPGAGSTRSEQHSEHYRPLGRPEVIRQLPAGTGVLLYGGLPPARLRLRPWFADRALRALAEGRLAVPGRRRQGVRAGAPEALPAGAEVVRAAKASEGPEAAR